MVGAVLDTNILARAAGSRNGPAGDLFERICDDHVLVVSLELLAELGRVFSYDRLRRMHQLGDAGIEAFIESIESAGAVVSLPTPLPRIVPYDPDDDAVVAAAVAGRVDVLVRGTAIFSIRVYLPIAVNLGLKSWTTSDFSTGCEMTVNRRAIRSRRYTLWNRSLPADAARRSLGCRRSDLRLDEHLVPDPRPAGDFSGGAETTVVFFDVYEALDPGCGIVAMDAATGRLAGRASSIRGRRTFPWAL